MDACAVRLAFGEAVRERRTEKGLSQEELAESSGLHRTYISLIERGIRSPTLISIISLAIALHLKPEELVKAALPSRALKGVKKRRAKRVQNTKVK